MTALLQDHTPGWIAGLAMLILAAPCFGNVPDTAVLADSLPADSFAVSGGALLAIGAAEQPLSLTLEQVTATRGGVNDTLDLIVVAPDFDLAGVVLKLGISSRYLRILEILPGEIVDSCRWEMFQAAEIGLPDGDQEIGQLWQITALARSSPRGPGPICYRFDRPATLARLVVSSGHVVSVPDTTAEVFFYWESCRDNVLSDKTGDFLAISKQVIDSRGNLMNIDTDSFPTRRGTPDNCVSSTARNAPHRLIEFRNGGVEFRLEIDFGDDQPDK